MNRFMPGLSAAAALMLAGASALAQAPAPPAPAAATPPAGPPQLTIKLIKPGVYMVVGAGGNSTVRLGKDGVVLVDTKNPGEAIYKALIDQIKTVTPLPVKVVIITHHHADHSGNSAAFESGGVPVIAHQGERAALQTYTPNGNMPRPAGPSVVYDTSLDAGIAGAPAVLHHYANGHTGGDTVVYFPDVKVVAAGDEVVAITPNVDYAFGASVMGWLTSLDEIAKLNFDDIVPGHGNDPLTRADFDAYRAKWRTLVERARAAAKAGVPKAQFLAAIKTDDLGWSINTPLWQQPARLDGFYAEMSK